MRTFLRFVSAGLLAPALLHVSARADARIDTAPSATHGSTVVVSGTGNTFIVPTVLDLNEDTAFDDLFIGDLGTGWLTLSNQATGSAGWIYLGYEDGSSGSLTLSSGATLDAAALVFATNFGSAGTALLTGTGTSANVGNLEFLSESSQLTLTDHAALTVTGSNYFYGGNLTVSGGATLTTGGLADENFLLHSLGADENTPATMTMLVTGAGTNWQNAGALTVSREYVDDDTFLTIADGATLTHNGTLSVGAGTTLTVSGGADVALTTTPSYSGIFRLDSTALVTGAGTTFNAAASLNVAQYSDATLTIADGATVSTALFNAYGGGGESAGDGRATINVTGTGSALNVSGALNKFFTSLHALNVSDHASITTNQVMKLEGTTTVSGSATLMSSYSGSGIQDLTGDITVTGSGSRFSTASNTAVSTGTLTVTAGGNFTAATNLQIASGFTASLVVSNGGTLDTLGAVVGYATTATGTTVQRAGHATITGAGSVWNNTEILTVGQFRNADLTIANGGRLVVGDYISGNESVGELRVGGSSAPTAPLTASALVTGTGSSVQARTVNVGWGLYATSTLTVTDHAALTTDSLTIYAGDTVSVGNSGSLFARELTARTGSTLTLQSNAILGLELSPVSPTFWNFAAGSTLTHTPGQTVYFDFTAGPGFDVGTYTLFAFDPAATMNGFSLTDFATHSGPAGYAFDYALTSSALSVTVSAAAIPEPSTTGLLLAGATAGLVVWQRRRRHARSHGQAR
jgi:T5SS/PEP-CTERM-associated repeat protein